MKTFFSKYKIVFWAVIVLLILNVSVLGTMMFRYYSQQRLVKRHMELPVQRHKPSSFLRKELDLGDEQFLGFQEARAEHQQYAYEIHSQLRNLRSAYIDELMQEIPDTVLLGTMRDSIGLLHAGLMKSTGDYYGRIRKLCTDKQADRLNAFFKEAMMNEGTPMMPMPGMQHQKMNPRRMNGPGRNRN
jgi:hypothetical protein